MQQIEGPHKVVKLIHGPTPFLHHLKELHAKPTSVLASPHITELEFAHMHPQLLVCILRPDEL